MFNKSISNGREIFHFFCVHFFHATDFETKQIGNFNPIRTPFAFEYEWYWKKSTFCIRHSIHPRKCKVKNIQTSQKRNGMEKKNKNPSSSTLAQLENRASGIFAMKSLRHHPQSKRINDRRFIDASKMAQYNYFTFFPLFHRNKDEIWEQEKIDNRQRKNSLKHWCVELFQVI